jgi:hypothetical protein
VLIFNRTASDACNGTLGMSVAGDSGLWIFRYDG